MTNVDTETKTFKDQRIVSADPNYPSTGKLTDITHLQNGQNVYSNIQKDDDINNIELLSKLAVNEQVDIETTDHPIGILDIIFRTSSNIRRFSLIHSELFDY